MPPMMRLRTWLPLLLAMFVAVRGLVPVGYMVEAPGADEAGGFALILCPTQNAALDLSRLQLLDSAASAAVHHHRLGGHQDTDRDSTGSSLDFSGECNNWLNNVSLALDLGVDPAIAPTRPSRLAGMPPARPENDTAHDPLQPRAPPALI
jgi:hypothetical protein